MRYLALLAALTLLTLLMAACGHSSADTVTKLDVDAAAFAQHVRRTASRDEVAEDERLKASIRESWELESLMPAYQYLVTVSPPEARRAVALAVELNIQDQDLQASRLIARRLLQEEVDRRSQQAMSSSHRYLPTDWEDLVQHELERQGRERSEESLREILKQQATSRRK